MIAEFEIKEFTLKSTGADGGHNYLSTIIDFKGRQRNMIVIFKSKADEKLIESLETVKVRGQLIDEGSQTPLTLLESELIQ